jgi:hypothetical protein
MKYIIKNCNNFIPEYSFFNNSCCEKGSVINGIYTTKCKDIPYCLIKQIVELCEIYKNMNATTTEDYARREVALKILNLLEIEEVDEKHR